MNTMDERCFLIIFCFFCWTPVVVETKNHTRIQAVEGRGVRLPCWADMGVDTKNHLDIEWMLVGNVTSPVIMMFSGGVVYNCLSPPKSERFSFASNNVWAGNASLYIRSLELNDSGNYHCKIKQGAAHYQNVVTLSVKQDDKFTTWIPATLSTVTEDITGHSNKTTSRDLKIVEISVILLLVFVLLPTVFFIHSLPNIRNLVRASRGSSDQTVSFESQVQQSGVTECFSNETADSMSQKYNTTPASALSDSEEITYACIQNLSRGSEQNEPMDNYQDVVYVSIHKASA
ncbi:uncharacterized protein LOC103190787 isoform X2 [Callorhinchus milii]|uniref:uncharacterized protein LOC103190787 isoform X2 n=1 Tax=Callorhinchus milii TaxID=7868 RepID=UPI001C3F690C|nr:uncharacterized protein LOC103190787 isoform X2 [Callorhinchus milii]